jgi:hypothetical protein
MTETLWLNDAWTDALDVAVAEARLRRAQMKESDRITEMIAGTRLDDRLNLSMLEIARQIALLTERLSDLPVVGDAPGSA